MSVTEDEARKYLAYPKFHTQLIRTIVVNGWAWLKNDLGLGNGFGGNDSGVSGSYKEDFGDNSSFRVELRVKKV